MSKLSQHTAKTGSAAASREAFFSPPSGSQVHETIRAKLAMGKNESEMEQEADGVADRIQARLEVGRPDDPEEKEADDVAAAVGNKLDGQRIQAKLEPVQRGREQEEGEMIFRSPLIRKLGEDIDANGSRESVVAAARSMIGKIKAKQDEGGQRVGAAHLLEIFKLAAPGVWPDAIVTTAGAALPSWCGIFSVWAHKKAGIDVGTWQMGKGVTAFNTIKQTTSPAAGDIGYIDQPYQHHCIITNVEGDKITSIDGNSGLYSEVVENVRPRSAYSGFFTAFIPGQKAQKKELRKKQDSPNSGTAPQSVEQALSSRKGKGEPLPANLEQQMGNAMGADLSAVRIHTDSKAAELSSTLHAQAFTHGNDVFFNKGKYQPGTKDGNHLLSHELAHTQQQKGGIGKKPVRKKEKEAETDKKDKLPRFDKDKLELHIEKISLPDFKGKRNKDKFITPLHAVQPRIQPEQGQDEKWTNRVKKDVDSKATAFLKDKKQKDGKYFLKASKSDFRFIGTEQQLQEISYIPKWNRDGKANIHHVDHIVELQLGGSHHEDNFELTDKMANVTSGNAIKLERERRMDEAIAILEKEKTKDLPNRQTLNTQYITHYHKIENWNLPYNNGKGNGDMYWEQKEIKNGDQFGKLEPMTEKEVRDSVGNDDTIVLYISETHGMPLRIKKNETKKKQWITGIDLEEFKLTNPDAADGQPFGTLKVKLTGTFSNRMTPGRGFTIAFNKTPGLYNTGYMLFPPKAKGLEGILEFNGLSPIEINEFRLDSKLGLVLNGNIITSVKIIDKTPIEISIIGDEFTVSKELVSKDMSGKFPKPFNLDSISLSVFASNKSGLGVLGGLDFSVEKLGKGQLRGMGTTKNGFGITGKFEFDPEVFNSEIKASYIEDKFSFSGNVTIDNGKLPGVKKLRLDLGYENDMITGKGTATLNIPGVKEVGITLLYNTATKLFTVTGDIALGDKVSGADIKVVLEKLETGWDIGIKGDIKPNIDVAGLKLNKVSVGYKKGIFNLAADAHFEKGKVTGDIALGVTNAALDQEGKLTEKEGKELLYYAKGELSLLILKGVETKLKVRIDPKGDIFIGGKLVVTEDKFFIDPKTANQDTDENLKVWDFKKSIPIASCGVASLVLGLRASVGLFYEFDGLKLDKGTNVTMEETNIKELEKAKLSSDISLSTGVKAGVDASIGASAGLEVLIAGVRGVGTIKFKLTAIHATAKAKVSADYSADEGLKFKEAGLEFDVKSSLGYSVSLGVEVYLQLYVTEVNLWSHTWPVDKLSGEKVFVWFNGPLKIPLTFGKDNAISVDDIQKNLMKGIGDHGKKDDMYTSISDKAVNNTGPTKEEKDEEARRNINEDVAQAYRGPHTAMIFAFNSSLDQNYFSSRLLAWDNVNHLEGLKPELRELLKKKIETYEMEEYDAFGTYIRQETAFDEETLLQIINDFLMYRPTLGSVHEINLKSLVKPKTSTTAAPVRKKRSEEQEEGYEVSGQFTERIEKAKPGGKAMDPDTLGRMSSGFGSGFADVRVHYDDDAIALASEARAQAFTHENHIFFNKGKYAPGTKEGDELLAHELTHVVQQGHGKPLRRKPEKDELGNFTGNYLFDPGKDGLSSAFFNLVKARIADGALSDADIRKLKRNAILRNGTVLHAEQLLMAAMLNPLNVPKLEKHRGGPLIIPMNQILDSDREKVLRISQPTMPDQLANPEMRMLASLLGLSQEAPDQVVPAMESDAEKEIRKLVGKSLQEEADKLVVFAQDTPATPLTSILRAMCYGAADHTKYDLLITGFVYAIASKAGHATASYLLDGRLKVDALSEAVFHRLQGSGSGTYVAQAVDDFDKADTIYLPTSLDILNPVDRALVIHELEHAKQDIGRSTAQEVDVLEIEAEAYTAQGRYLLDESLLHSGNSSFAAGHINSGPLFYWSTLKAAQQNKSKYETIFIKAATLIPGSRNEAEVKKDLGLSNLTVHTKIREALLKASGSDGNTVYRPGKTKIGGNPNHFFKP